MDRIESIELERQRGRIAADVGRLAERYRAIFEWNVPDVDRAAVDRPLLAEIRRALDDIERAQPR